MAEKKKRRIGKPPHEPTVASRKQVETMAGFGIPEADIALSIGITQPTLDKYYEDEMHLGRIKANSAVAQSLYKKAIGDGNNAVIAAIFWAKTRMRWKESTVHEHTGADGEDIKTITEIRWVVVDTRTPSSARLPPPPKSGSL